MIWCIFYMKMVYHRNELPYMTWEKSYTRMIYHTFQRQKGHGLNVNYMLQKFSFNANSSLQISHVFVLSLECISKCRLEVSFPGYDSSHTWQEYGLSPKCIFMCVFKCVLYLNVLLHTSQENGRLDSRMYFFVFF